MQTNINTSDQLNQQNNLRQARHRSGLESKHVALLSKKSAHELLRYERGVNPPNLETALKLEIIYRTPVRLLFQNLFKQLRAEIEEIKQRQASFLPNIEWFPKSLEQLKQEEFCFYAEMVKKCNLSELEIEAINKHVIELNNAVSDCKYYKSKKR